jgi:hypothetical protein
MPQASVLYSKPNPRREIEGRFMPRKDAILLAAVFTLIATPAFAYLDPGTGSMIIQVIVGAIAAALVSIKLAWHRIKVGVLSVFSGKKDAKTAPTDRD